MVIKSIAHAYWRQIKAGNRTFDGIKDEEMKEQVKILAQADVKNRVITTEEYEQYTGEKCPVSPEN